MLGPTPRVPGVESSHITFLTKSCVTDATLTLVQRPYFENHHLKTTTYGIIHQMLVRFIKMCPGVIENKIKLRTIYYDFHLFNPPFLCPFPLNISEGFDNLPFQSKQFLLKYTWLTMLYQFQVYSKVIQLYKNVSDSFLSQVIASC